MLTPQQLIIGLICPCLESQEDRSIRESVALLQKGKLFKWRKKKSSSNMFGMFGSDDVYTVRVYLAQHRLICALEDDSQVKDDNAFPADDGRVGFSRIGGIKTKGTLGVSIIGNHPQRPGEVLLDLECTTNKQDRNEFSDSLNICLEAYRKLPDDGMETDNESESSSSGGNILKARAQRAAHFAKQEIEMKQRKREREARKAKYVKDAGGLKYTALAMANRA
mmetsp:Transcript_8321/g.12371  ORF Transcript_8321/g.12371 Transcript_8321/m.12371 type:complete len:222 (-) Transcript_8321:193-858(-)